MLTRRSFLAASLLAADSFARTIADLSGPETGPPADNLLSNEDSYPRLAPAGSCYLGVGPDQNLTYVAQARPPFSFVLDHRRRNLLLHLVHKALIALSPDRVSYLSHLTARVPSRPLPADPTAADLAASFGPAPFDRHRLAASIASVAAYLRPFGVVERDEWPALATIQSKLAGPGLDVRFLALPIYPTLGRLITTLSPDGRPAHFLASEPLYRTLREVERDDRLIPLVGDFAGPDALPKLAARLRRDGLTLGVFYISDVEFFLLRSGKFPAYLANLARLPWAEGAILIRSSTREIAHPSRVRGDSSTTIVRPVDRFLADARAGRITRVDDLIE